MALLNKVKIYVRKFGEEENTRKVLPACFSLPDFGVDPEKVDTTTFDDDVMTNELGIGEAGDLVFGFRYRKGVAAAYRILRAHEVAGDELSVDVEFASGMTVSFDSSCVSTKLIGGGVNEVKNFEANFGLMSAFDIEEGSDD